MIGGTDHDFEQTSVTFPPGETKVRFNIIIFDDDVPEGNEYLMLRIFDLSNVLFGFPYYCVISIVDDDDDSTITSVNSKLLLL